MPTFLWSSLIAFIQPIHGQGYNSDIPQPDALVIYIGAFSILTAQPGRRSIYNKILTYEHLPIVEFIIFLDRFSVFSPNVHVYLGRFRKKCSLRSSNS